MNKYRITYLFTLCTARHPHNKEVRNNISRTTKKIIFLCVLFLSLFSFSQNPVKIYDLQSKKEVLWVTINEYDTFFVQKRYDESKLYNLKVLSDSTSNNKDIYKSLYRVAVCCANLNQIDSAFYYLDLYVKYSPDDMVLFVDTNFNILKPYKEWDKLKEKIEFAFLENIGEVKDTNLALRLLYLGIEDQKYRITLFALNQYRDEDRKKSIESHYAMQDTCVKIVEKYGIPTISMVGAYSSLCFFFILQHTEFEVMNKYYPLVKKVWKKGDYSSKSYAMLTDRILKYKGKKQIYGTQLTWSTADKKYPSQYYLYPVKDFKNVNKRREKMGFKETVEEYVKCFPNGFIPKEYYE
ncbi:MAG: DUF6624 domain-containing protein [Bacteroidaceae bacterium]|nr:DUF6624 domain-containing protein [Bacteroidaceae bacterium]MEA5100818.1 DUF6624 domain-containing protein [Bacteroidales bacterium]